jgi:hypothetical protein
MFVEKLNQVTAQTIRERQGSKGFREDLSHAIGIWCHQFNMSQDITDYILRGYDQPEIQRLTNYICEEGRTEDKNFIVKIPTIFGDEFKRFKVTNPFYQHINALFYRMNIRSEDMKFIVLIAFAITAIGYFIYRLNQQKQETTRGEEPRPYNTTPLSPTVSTVQTPSIITSSIPKNTNQFLILVVSHSQADFLESLVAKSDINSNDGESLYEITKYLWLGSESEFSQTTANIKQYSVSKGAESEYDIYLVYVELKEADEGFTSNVNQLDRYDAFRKLDDLALNLRISPRLQMEAYGNIKVYNR